MRTVTSRLTPRSSAPLLLVLALCLFGGQLASTQHQVDHAPGTDIVCLQCANLSDRPALVHEAPVTADDRRDEHPRVVIATAVADLERPATRARAPPSPVLL